MKLIFAIMLATLSGCALSPYGAVSSGGANYTYSKTAEGCSITINSARDVSGVDLMIEEDCSVSVTANNAGGDKAIEVIGRALELAK